ncbi:MAG TPA: hypothetical protein VD767_05480, partial [Thermomicrobiales bacterium]|nr:hypothetical protein [Thermomicrobiales bacterium]
DIEVEGQDIFPVFDVDDIIESLESGVEPTGEPTEEPTEAPATEEPTEEPLLPLVTEEPTEEPATEEPTEAPTEVPATEEPTEEVIGPVGTPEASPEASPVANSNTGLLGPGNYLSPQHQVLVTWTQTWEPDPNLAEPVASHETNAVDELHLADALGEGVEIFISIEAPNPAFDAETYLDGMSDPAYIQDVLGMSAQTTIVTSTSSEQGAAIVYIDSGGTTPVVRIIEVRVVDEDTISFVDVGADASLVDEDLINSVANEVQVNRQPGLSLLDPAEVVAAIE